MSYYNYGVFCHWCGKQIQRMGNIRRGKHAFCNNGGRCRQAHYRAYQAYLKSANRVTSRSGPGDQAGHVEIEQCNAGRSSPSAHRPVRSRRPRILRRDAREEQMIILLEKLGKKGKR